MQNMNHSISSHTQQHATAIQQPHTYKYATPTTLQERQHMLQHTLRMRQPHTLRRRQRHNAMPTTSCCQTRCRYAHIHSIAIHAHTAQRHIDTYQHEERIADENSVLHKRCTAKDGTTPTMSRSCHDSVSNTL
ncbi:hypothetical protein TNCT_292201 [Trichonephila clavata]|uniref:Uncharacterized protein n=1 Tax=Trichonephila clavata TaxID=2740835 RepID=A0A8X6FXI6_TRICU|nr:hypothetical protein TNCT_292201 [Trichonephila clavata]